MDIATFERVCEQFYAANSSEAARREAQNLMSRICGATESVAFLQQVLVNSSVSSAVVSASTALTKLVASNWINITEQEKTDIYGALVHLINREFFPELARPYLNRFFAKVVKYAWLDGAKFQTVFDDLRALGAPGVGRVLDTYTEVIREMNPQTGRDLSRFRRTALSFRDQALVKMAEFAWQLIERGEVGVQQHKALKLLVEALAFDFLGACPDETNDDTASVMVPHSFVFLRQISIPQVLFNLLGDLGSKESAKLALQALVLVASFRRSFYLKDEDRRAVLFAFLSGSAQLISGVTPASQRLLSDPDCVHEICRLIGRMKTGDAVSDLIEVDGFQLWLGAVWQLTERVVLTRRNAQVETANARFYLLSFWGQVSVGASRMTAVPAYLQEAINRVLTGFIENLIHNQEAAICDSEDGSPDETEIAEQTEIFAALITSSKHFAVSTLQTALMHSGRHVNVAWGVYLTSVLLHAVAEQKIDSPETVERLATISGVIMQGMRTSRSDIQTELANLAFLEGLRKAFLSDQAKRSSSVHGRHNFTAMDAEHPLLPPPTFVSQLVQSFQLHDEKDLLSLAIDKIVLNLNVLFENELVLKRTLQLFQDFATSVSFIDSSDIGFGPQLVQGGKLLLELPGIKSLVNGGHRELGFLKSAIPHFGKYRTLLYHVLGKIVFLDSAALFKSFMASIAQVLASLWQTFQSNPHALDAALLSTVCTLARDLRGVCMACMSQDAYKQFFEFLVDDPRLQGKSRLILFTGCLELIQTNASQLAPSSTLPILKFLAEFTLNKQSRISFDANSPGGILLFREACKCVMAVGRLVMPNSPNTYRDRLKPMGVSLSVLNHALQGQYANMALFELYGDQALSSALHTGMSMVLSVSPSDLLVYSKVMKPVYTFLEQCIAKTGQINVVVENADSGCIVQVLQLLEEGVLAFDGTVAMQSCTILDALATWLFDRRTTLSSHRNLGQVITFVDQRLRASLSLLLQVLIQGEFTSIWSLSRPLLPLILLEKEHWVQITSDTTRSQLTDDRKTKLAKAFQALMVNIPDDLSQKNRETFTKHVYDLSATLKQN